MKQNRPIELNRICLTFTQIFIVISLIFLCTAATTTTSTKTTSLTTTTIEPTTIPYLLLTITNNQVLATNAPFQQMITFRPSSYGSAEASDLGNIRFYLSKARPTPANELYSWCESGCSYSATNAIFWIKLPSTIAANGNAIVNMTFQTPTSGNYEYDGKYAGEAPQQTPVYAKYDNGNSIFNYYLNMVSDPVVGLQTGYGNDWMPALFVSITTANEPTGHVGNVLGISCEDGCLAWAMSRQITPALTGNFIVDAFALTSSNPEDIGFGFSQSTSNNIGYAFDPGDSSNRFLDFEESIGGGQQIAASMISNAMQTISYSNLPSTWYTEEVIHKSNGQMIGSVAPGINSIDITGETSNSVSITNTVYKPPYNSLIFRPYSTGENDITAWGMALARAYPPNDIMPSISIANPGNILPTTSTTSSTSSTTSTSTTTTIVPTPAPYLLLFITNNQISATPAPFQQMVSFNPTFYKSAESSDLGNIRFYLSNSIPIVSNELYSWCESGCSSSATNAIFWVRLPNAISANGKTIINMTFQTPSSGNYEYNGNYAGEAPQLPPLYGQYDNGNSVFVFYDNFAGNVLSPKWTYTAAMPQINNGITMTPYCIPPAIVATSATYSYGVVEFYGTIQSNVVYTQCVASAVGYENPAGSQQLMIGHANGLNGLWSNNGIGGGQASGLGYGSNYIYSLTYSANTATAELNYGSPIRLSAYLPTLPDNIGFITQFISGAVGPVYWFRFRSVPPNGIMPSLVLIDPNNIGPTTSTTSISTTTSASTTTSVTTTIEEMSVTENWQSPVIVENPIGVQVRITGGIGPKYTYIVFQCTTSACINPTNIITFGGNTLVNGMFSIQVPTAVVGVAYYQLDIEDDGTNAVFISPAETVNVISEPTSTSSSTIASTTSTTTVKTTTSSSTASTTSTTIGTTTSTTSISSSTSTSTTSTTTIISTTSTLSSTTSSTTIRTTTTTSTAPTTISIASTTTPTTIPTTSLTTSVTTSIASTTTSTTSTTSTTTITTTSTTSTICVVGDPKCTTTTTSSTTTSSTSTSSVTTTIISGQPLLIVPIVITNNQPTPTAMPFQQMVSFNAMAYEPYEAVDLGNIRFLQGSATYDSWCESGCMANSTNSTFWILLPQGIGATSNVTLNMTFFSTRTKYDGVNAGEAPQFSATYAQYDNGASIFPFYDNFAGSILSSSWTPASSNLITTVNNGLTLSASDVGWIGLVNTYPITIPFVEDAYANIITSGEDWGLSDSAYISPAWEVRPGQGFGLYSSSGAQLYLGGTAAPQQWYLMSFLGTSTTSEGQVNYGQIDSGTISTAALDGNLELGEYSNPIGYRYQFQWVRTRSYPPNGIMSTVTFGTPITNSTAPTTTIISVESTITSTVAQGGGGGGGGSGGGGGGGGSFKPTVKKSSEFCYAVTNLTQKSFANVSFNSTKLGIRVNYITPTFAGLTINNNSYEIHQNSKLVFEPGTTQQFTMNLTSLSYLPVKDIINISLCAIPSHQTRYNNTFNGTLVLNESGKLSYHPIGPGFNNFNLSFLGGNVTVNLLSNNGAVNLTVSNVIRHQPLPPPGFYYLKVFYMSISGPASVQTALHYNCSINSSNVLPYIFINNSWKEAVPFVNIRSGCYLTFSVPKDPIVALLEKNTTAVTTTVPILQNPTAVHVYNVFDFIVVGVVLILIVIEYVKVGFSKGKKENRQSLSNTVREDEEEQISKEQLEKKLGLKDERISKEQLEKKLGLKDEKISKEQLEKKLGLKK